MSAHEDEKDCLFRTDEQHKKIKDDNFIQEVN